MRPVRMAARAMLAAIFIIMGTRHLRHPEPLTPTAKRVTDRVGPLLERVDSHVPHDARTLVMVNAGAQVLGGVLLATGHATRPAAALLAGTLVPTTLVGHPFWAEEDP